MWERHNAHAYATHADKRVFVTDLNVSWVAPGRLVRWRVEVSGKAGDGERVAVCSPASPPRRGSDPR
jgi:hypothetical protein